MVIDLFNKLSKALNPTRIGLFKRLNKFFVSGRIDKEALLDLEEALILSDIGYETAHKIILKVEEERPKENIKIYVQDKIREILDKKREGLKFASKPPTVIIVIGVNGVGKTTTIAKLAARFKNEGKKVLLSAADTYRAAAAEQLEIWAKRINVDVVKQPQGTDPGAVVYDSLKAALSRAIDVVIIDTAGRLHTEINLINELAKIKRVAGKQIEGAPHEVLLVLDATCGQNGLSQAKEFMANLDVTGLILTKLDGTSKGGIVITISDQLNIPVKFVGTGEKMEDLVEFEAEAFSRALFE